MKRLLAVLILLSISLLGCSSANSQEKLVENDDLDEVIDMLLSNELLVPLGEVPIPEGTPMTPEVLELGKLLFFDHRLSGNNEVSCQTCHDSELGYGDGQATFTKIDGALGLRNSPTVINSGFYTTLFWDGRAESLEEQALGPIQDPGEMNQPLDKLVDKLKLIDGYEELFLAAFDDGITIENIAKALAAFQRLIVVNETPYDRFLKGDRNALTSEEIRGLDLFAGKAFCITCHNGENLSDNEYYNLGIDSDDEGRFAVTGDDRDLGRIRTPGLYGITHTAPYMRDGSLETLEEVIEFYNRGGDNHPNKSIFMTMFMSELQLTAEEKSDLLAFLKVLGGEPPNITKPELPGLK
ncbi:cytochrome-c peroxidase [Anaerobacillus isosaccharinicus]|uniref:Methylamine utilization protein MauG n=1 Tax=Anaerobacillus isosaccharinicus TaxID=1532552 RepID=A0A1S2MH27_9BACI|nr:cytochrome c peroxidase [Anaerobacillus isosaccharinicus]MBA5585107.1 cytochrome-c peroxidase [Anaerobacillus isosaccharinicus]QOY36550.1 cytochrome-c peroxidase [Anaerobacillus isosaccharinicus]